MSARHLIVLTAVVGGLLLPSSASAMLPATESGYRPSHPTDCTWRCVKKKVPATFNELASVQQQLVEADVEASKKMMRLNQQIEQMEMQMALYKDAFGQLTELTKTRLANAQR